MANQNIEIDLGAGPSDEDQAQVGSENYSSRSRAECSAYKDQILRHYPVPEGVSAGIRTCVSPHELGSYRELSAVYNCESGQAWAYAIEGDTKKVLRSWDDVSRIALGLPAQEEVAHA